MNSCNEVVQYIDQIVQNNIEILNRQKVEKTKQIEREYDELISSRTEGDPLYGKLVSKKQELINEQESIYEKAVREIYTLQKKFR